MTRLHPYLLAALFVAGGALLTWLGRTLAPGELVMLGAGYLALWGVAARDFVRKLFGPVFAYELTRLGRKRGTFVARFLYVAVVGLLFAYWYLLWRESIRFEAVGNTVPSHRAAQFADQFFIAFSLAQFGAIFLLAPAFVAGTVAQEKERKTLEFLLATDLTGSEIVFGKAAARLITVLQFVVAGLGVIVFLQLFGGIDPDLLLASTAASAITALGITSLGLFYSVRARRPREAIMATALTVGLYLAASFFVWIFVKQGLPQLMALTPNYTVFGFVIDGGDLLRGITAAADAFGAGNPMVVLSNVGVRGGYTAALLDAALRGYALFWAALSAFCLAYAVLRLRPIALRQAEGTPPRRKARRARSRPAMGDDPVAWKEIFVERGPRRSVLILLVCVATFVVPAFLAAMYFSPDYAFSRPYFAPDNRVFAERLADFREGISVWMRTATVVIGFIGLFAAASRGAGAIAGEKDRDTWVTLSSLPLSPWQLARGKWLGAALAPRRLYALLIAVWALGLATGAADPPKLLLTATYFAVYASAFAWLGVWCSVTAKSTLSATVRALFAGLFAVGGFWLVPLLSCSLPMGLFHNMWGSDVDDAAEEGTVIFAAMTPPFMLGVLPAPPWESARTGVFGPNLTAIGPAMPLVGLLGWLGVGWLFARRATAKIARALNRVLAPKSRGTGNSRPSTRPRNPTALP